MQAGTKRKRLEIKIVVQGVKPPKSKKPKVASGVDLKAEQAKAQIAKAKDAKAKGAKAAEGKSKDVKAKAAEAAAEGNAKKVAKAAKLKAAKAKAAEGQTKEVKAKAAKAKAAEGKTKEVKATTAEAEAPEAKAAKVKAAKAKAAKIKAAKAKVHAAKKAKAEKAKRLAAMKKQQKKKPKQGVPPFLAHFPSHDVKHEEQFPLTAYRPKDPNKKGPLFLVHQMPGANMIGSTAVPPQTAHNKARYCVGIYNRAKRRLTLQAVGGNTVVKLESQTRYLTDAEVAGLNKPQYKQRPQVPQDPAARRTDARRLVEAFGSTRRRRQLRQRDEAQVVVDRNADEDRLRLIMGEVAAKAAATGETREEVMARIGAARVIPVHNPQATKPEDAYKINAMFPQQLMTALNVGQLLHAAEKPADLQALREKKRVPSYIISRLQLLSNYPAGKDAERKRKARHLALLAALIQLATAGPKLRTFPPRPATDDGPARPGGLEELARKLNMGRKDVLEVLLDKFYEKGVEGGNAVYTRDDYRKQLLLMHVLVVALEVEGWNMAPLQFDGLREALKMTTPDVVSRFRELGCSCSSAKLQTDVNTSITSYAVRLLPDGSKTLEQCFPKQKSGSRQKAR